MNNSKKIFLFIIFISFLLYIFGAWSVPLTDPDEVFYAVAAKDMLLYHSFFTPLQFGHPQFGKPPFFYWLLIASFKLFGINRFSVRLVPALSGVIGVIATYFFTKRVFNDEQAAINSSIILAGSFLYLVQSKMVLTDISFSVAIALSLYAFYLWFKFSEKKYLYAFGFFSAVATLIKTPLGTIIPLVIIMSFLAFSGNPDKIKQFFKHKWWVLFFVLALPWYLYVTIKYGRDFYMTYFVRDHYGRLIHAEHGSSDTWYFYIGIMILGMLPWTFYFLNLCKKWFRDYRYEILFFFLWAGGFLYAFYPVHSKLASYILPIWPPMAISLALSLQPRYLQQNWKRILIGSLYIIFGLAMFFIPSIIKKIYPHLYSVVHYKLLTGVILLAIIEISAGFLYLKKKINLSIFVQIFIWMALFITMAPLVLKIKGQYTNADLRTIIKKYNYSGTLPIIATKYNARGAYFYTGQKIIVLCENSHPFWSEEDVQVISTDKQIRNVFDRYSTLLCAIDRKEFRRINNIFKGKRKNKVIYRNGDRIVVLSLIKK
jgi:4-amino-4-deoxy-L-arabinose transferase-like glycosyltransferase